ncbi:MAG TPA: branched-chain amino acid ABC transporter substrate-binding protein [Solirubrobacteraceae bacterium]|nr:branched-chain amino acid ABC transporter substrate-binding protein [Solirubrobacteraceae bacterium]
MNSAAVRLRTRRRRGRPAAAALGLLLLGVLACALSGCGGVGVSGAAIVGDQLTIYSSMPLQGSEAAAGEQIVNGEKLALAQSGGRVGRFRISFVSLDDAKPTTGRWEPGVTATNAKTAAQDTSTIAYIGDYSSAATAVSLPLTNAAGILQVSPASPYVGLTSSLQAGQGEPERFYLSGKRTFGRLLPGDPVQATAQIRLLSALGVHKLYVLDNQDAFQEPLARLVASDAEQAGITVAAHDSIATTSGSVFTGEVEKIVASGAQAVFLAGDPGEGAAALLRQLYSADPGLWLLGASSLTEEGFTAQLGPAAQRTLLTTPLLPVDLYPPAARRVLSDYRRVFGAAGEAEALYGYEAMSVVLDAIRRAGVYGGDRQTVIERFFATSERSSVIGSYSMQANGETTLSRYAVDRVIAGRPVFWRTIEAG